MNPDSVKTGFNSYTPEELSELYKSNPNLFDELADDAIRQACKGRTPEQTVRNRQRQWTIDAQLRKAKTPLGRMQIMENIFYNQVFGDNGELVHLMYSCTELLTATVGMDRIPSRKPALYLVKK